MKINNFDVFKRMSEENNQAMKLAPLGNIGNMKQVKAGTEITIGVAGNVIKGLMFNEYVGGLILCGKEEFEKTKRLMQEQAEQEEMDAR